MTRFKRHLKTIRTLAANLAFLALLGSSVYAQEEKRAPNTQITATPDPTASFCVNKVTQAMRLVIDVAGIARPCHKNEFGISLLTLEALASGSPTPTPAPSSSPTDSPIPTASPTATPVSGNAPMMVDASGAIIGPVMGDYLGGKASLVLVTINGTQLELPASRQGFLDAKTSGGFPTWWEYWSGQECLGGTPTMSVDAGASDYLIVAGGTIPLTYLPVAQIPEFNNPANATSSTAALGGGPYVYGGIVYYGGTLVDTSAQSFRNIVDPGFNSGFPDGPCNEGPSGGLSGSFMTIVSATLPSFTPPFHIQ